MKVSEKKDGKKGKKEEKGDNENLGALIANIGYFMNATSSLFIAILFRINDNVIIEAKLENPDVDLKKVTLHREIK